MTLDIQKADRTLKMQFIRMQLEVLAYCRIKEKKMRIEDVKRYSDFWLKICEENDIQPINDFTNEYQNFEKETVLKFAPAETLINMQTKAYLTLEKNGISREDIEKITE